MKLEQMRERLKQVNAKLEELNSIDNRTEEQNTEFDALLEESEKVVKDIERAEKLEAHKASLNLGSRKTAPTQITSAKEITVGDQKQDKHPNYGFESTGHMLMAVKDRAYGQELHPNLKAAQGANEKIGTEGGFLVPKEQAEKIELKLYGDQSLLPKTNQLRTSMVGNSISLPVDETAPWAANAFGAAKWEGEGVTHSGSKPNIGSIDFKLSKLTSFAVVTEELLSDAPALQSYINARIPEALMQKVNQAIITGSGVKMPLGILESGFKYMVEKEGGQSAATILFANVRKMLARLMPGSYQSAVWLANPGIKDQLFAMEFSPGSSTPVPVYLPGNSAAGRPYETLFGLPINYLMAGVKALGTEGDLILADLSTYWTVMKANGITSKVSYEVFFSTDEVAFKYQLRMDGKAPWKNPATPENGNFEMSGLVTLETR